MRRATVGITLTLTVLALAGCSATGSTAVEPSVTPVRHTIPSSSNRPADPVETPAADGSVTPQDAPLAQLWALVDSSLRDAGGYADSTRGAGVIPADIHDFGSAIRTRCVPKRTPPERAELTSLWNAIAAEAKTAGADLTPAVRAYFARASALCM